MRASYIEDFTQWSSEFDFNAEVVVRFSETDMYGHLNNTVPFTYFEYARIEFLKHVDFTSWLNPKSENIPVVADLQCDFVKQVFFDEKLKVYVKAASIGNSSVDIHYWAVNEQSETCFVGRGTVVQINKKTGKSNPWTDSEKQILCKSS